MNRKEKKDFTLTITLLIVIVASLFFIVGLILYYVLWQVFRDWKLIF